MIDSACEKKYHAGNSRCNHQKIQHMISCTIVDAGQEPCYIKDSIKTMLCGIRGRTTVKGCQRSTIKAQPSSCDSKAEQYQIPQYIQWHNSSQRTVPLTSETETDSNERYDTNDKVFPLWQVDQHRNQKQEILCQKLIQRKMVDPPIDHRHRFFPSPSQIFISCINAFFLG